MELGLNYLTLDRAASTLSTGERQRMQLARAVCNRTTGVLYVLDEPSIGLHPSNQEGLIGVMQDSAGRRQYRDPGGRPTRYPGAGPGRLANEAGAQSGRTGRTDHCTGHAGTDPARPPFPGSPIWPVASSRWGSGPRPRRCLRWGGCTCPLDPSTRYSRWKWTCRRGGSSP